MPNIRGVKRISLSVSALSEPSAALFVVVSEFLSVFLVIGFASRNKVLEEHAVNYFTSLTRRTQARPEVFICVIPWP